MVRWKDGQALGGGEELHLLGERTQDQPPRTLVLGTLKRPGCP